MQNTFEVIICAKPEFSEFIKKMLQKDTFIRICGEAFNFLEMEKLVLENKQAILIIETGHNTLTSPTFKNVVSFLINNNVIFLAICDSVQDGFNALQNGATTMIVRPKDIESQEANNFLNNLRTKIKTIHKQNEFDKTRILKKDLGSSFEKIIAIGSSTGGTETLLKILKELPPDTPPVLIVQHMPPVFSKLYANRMNKESGMTVWEAKDGDLIRPGLVLIAPGDFHMTVVRTSEGYAVRCEKGEKVNGHCPSVDTLFYSVARLLGKKAVGVILTGMGADGAMGLLEMRRNGALTLGQDEKSCVVYGMPKAAYDMGAVARQVSLDEMAKAIMENE